MADPVILDIHVQPRASRTEVAGRHGDAIKVRLRAPPVEGAANEELLRYLSERLGVPRAALAIVTGHAGRRKRVAITGVADAEARLLADTGR